MGPVTTEPGRADTPVISVPYHLSDPFELPTLDRAAQQVDKPKPSGASWAGLAPLYADVAESVADARPDEPAVIVSGDCAVAVAVVAGLQRADRCAGVVWFDAHGDFNTAETTVSGYLGGLPLAAVVGLERAPQLHALGLRPVAPDRVTLVGARDLDAPERVLLDDAGVRRTSVDALARTSMPSGPLYVHIDLDVVDPALLGDGLRYPADGGCTPDALVGAVETLVRRVDVAAVTVACTWFGDSAAERTGAQLANRLVALV